MRTMQTASAEVQLNHIFLITQKIPTGTIYPFATYKTAHFFLHDFNLPPLLSFQSFPLVTMVVFQEIARPPKMMPATNRSLQ